METEKTKSILKAENVMQEVENMRLYMQTPEQAAQALLIIKKLRNYADFWEEKVKGRAAEIMIDKDLFEIDLGEYMARKVSPSETRKYDVHKIIEAIGLERAMGVGLTISSASIEKYIKNRGVSDQELEIINKGVKVGHKKGFIGIYPKAEKKGGKK